MKKIFSLNDNWKFRKENESKSNDLDDYFDMFRSNVKTGISSDERGFIFDEDWDVVNLPHDWSLADKASCKIKGNTQGHKPQRVAWYRKAFTLGDEFDGERLFLKFDAVAINSQIWFNSIKVAESESGYTPIIVEITDFVEIGRQNILSVKTDNRIKEGWWYEGGGIYANVSLIATEKSFIKPYEVFVKPQKENGNRWKIYVETDVEINSDLSLTVKCDELNIIEERTAENINHFAFDIKNPRLWSCENPNLYTMTVTLLKNSEVIDKEDVRFGFRWTEFDSEKGCFINGNSVKIKGVCIHHDFAGIGVALNEEAQRYRIKKLKEMGCNAIRTSHNPQLEAFYKICDEEGILVMDEVRHFSSTDECMRQLEVFIKRDRNHPSVIMWSMYNEELLQCTKTGD